MPRFLLPLCLLLVASVTRAQAGPYDGLQLAPTLHFAAAVAGQRGGIGVDLSLRRWLGLELWGARVSRPMQDRWYPGAWSAGLAVRSRVTRKVHAFVYGLGLVYTNEYQCPRGCAIPAAIVLDEQRALVDMFSAAVQLGYELRLPSHWFVRALMSVNLPFAAREIVHFDRSERYRVDRAQPITFMHVTGELTVGYAFQL